MREDVFNALVVLTILVFAAILWIAAWMDTETGVYPSPTEAEIHTPLVCDPDCHEVTP